MTATRPDPGPLARAGFALALLALVLQAMFPAGFMAAAPGPAAHGVPIVICTAEGRVLADWDPGADHDSKKAPAKSSAPCAFAGHALASAPPLPARVSIPATYAAPAQPARVAAVFPGRGLAAPPPPAIGPPALS